MKICKKDAQTIGLTAFGGFVAFATLALSNIIIRKKLVSPLKVETPFLEKHDEMLMILLADVENALYDYDPVAYVRLVDACDVLVKLKVQLQQQLTNPSEFLDTRIDAFLNQKRASSNIERLKEVAKKELSAETSYSCFSSLSRIEKQLDFHESVIFMLTETIANK